MRALRTLLAAGVALLGAVAGACQDKPAASAAANAVVVVKTAPARDAGGSAEPVDATRRLPPLVPAPPNASAPPSAWVLERTWPSPPATSVDPLRTSAPRYVDERECPPEARRAIAKLRLPKSRVHLCEVRRYRKGTAEQRVALLLSGKPRDCDEGCVYERDTVLVRGAAVKELDDVFYLPLPEANEALRDALPSAGVHLRLDAKTADHIVCSPPGSVWLTEGAERRWGWLARYQDATCRVLTQLEPRDGATTALLYELKVDGSASLANALDEKWRSELTLTPIARRMVRFPQGARVSLDGAPALPILDEKLYSVPDRAP